MDEYCFAIAMLNLGDTTPQNKIRMKKTRRTTRYQLLISSEKGSEYDYDVRVEFRIDSQGKIVDAGGRVVKCPCTFDTIFPEFINQVEVRTEEVSKGVEKVLVQISTFPVFWTELLVHVRPHQVIIAQSHGSFPQTIYARSV